MIPSIRDAHEIVSLGTGGSSRYRVGGPNNPAPPGASPARAHAWLRGQQASCPVGPAGIAFQWVYSEKLGET